MSDDIRPGVPTASMLGAIQRWRVRVYENARRVAQLQPRPVRKFPARLTAVHAGYSPARYSWAEEWWDETGVRQLRPGGRSGTDSFNPAFGYGDGTTIDPANLPQQVWLYERVEATDPDTGEPLGVVYEFPAYCACESGAGSGAGGGGGYVLVSCCPNPIPTTLYATFTSPGCARLDGASAVLTTTTWAWGTANPGGSPAQWSDGTPIQVGLSCSPGSFGWTLSVSGPDDTSGCALSFTGAVPSVTCHPFSYTVTGTIRSNTFPPACPCDGQSFTLTITE